MRNGPGSVSARIVPRSPSPQPSVLGGAPPSGPAQGSMMVRTPDGDGVSGAEVVVGEVPGVVDVVPPVAAGSRMAPVVGSRGVTVWVVACTDGFATASGSPGWAELAASSPSGMARAELGAVAATWLTWSARCAGAVAPSGSSHGAGPSAAPTAVLVSAAEVERAGVERTARAMPKAAANARRPSPRGTRTVRTRRERAVVTGRTPRPGGGRARSIGRPGGRGGRPR